MQETEYKTLCHHFPKTITGYELAQNTLTVHSQDNAGEPLSFAVSFFQRGVIRVRLCRQAFEQILYPVVRDDFLVAENVELAETPDKLAVHFHGYVLELGKERFTFCIKKGGLVMLEENTKDVNSVNEGFDRIPPMGYSTGAHGTTAGMNIGLKLRYDECVYGFGEHFTSFNKVGQKVTMRNFDTLGCRDETSYKNIPFCVSSYGYGLFVHNHQIFDFCVGTKSAATFSVHVPAESLEYYLILGDVKEVVATYTQLTGPAAMPPEWSFGLWYSTGFQGNSRKNVEDDAKRFAAEQIPCSVMHFDCYWLRQDKWCDFVWDDALYPDRKEMLDQLKRQGYKVCLWINPYVTIVSEMYEEGKAKGYFVQNQAGEPYQADLWHGLLSYCAIVDFTNPKAAQWYQGKVKGVLAEGVDVLKTDFGEDIPYDAVFWSGQSGKEMRNVYARLYNKAVFEATAQAKGEALVWARSGCAGMQQFPVCWSGDPYSSYEGMAGTLRGGLSMAMSGVPFWSHDMGGFYGEINEDIFVRWSQFGLFSSHSRLHGVSSRQPWAYGDRAKEILKKYINLKYELMPYILQTAKSCVAQGVPFIRPLVMEHPDDLNVRNLYDEYYFGDSYLVAPVFGGDGATRNVYLPDGCWKDLFTGKKYQGRSWYCFTCALEYMPVFQKERQE